MNRTTEWLNENRYRAYPFRDNSIFTFVETSPATLPLDMIVDASLVDYWRTGGTLTLVTVSKDSAAVPTITALFSYEGFELPVYVPASAALPYTAVCEAGTVYGIRLSVTFSDGVSSFITDNPGAVTRSLLATPEILPALVVSQSRRRIDGIIAKGDTGPALTGIIKLEEGYNCRIAVNPDLSSIRVSSGYGFGAGVPCPDVTADPCQQSLLWFNGLHAGEDGNFNIIAGPGVQIELDPAAYTVIIRGTVKASDIFCGSTVVGAP